MGVWIVSLVIRYRVGQKANPVEIAAFVFSLLISLAYLRTAGYNRYLFPAQIVSLIYFPETVSHVFFLIRRKLKLSILFQSTLLPIGVLILFVAGIYQLMFHSWVANFYNSHKTEYWQSYFKKVQPQNILFYNVPEVAIFDKSGSYSQYIELAPSAGISVGKDNKALLEKGGFDSIIMVSTAYDDMKSSLDKLYHPVETAYKYTILARNK